MPQIRIKPGLIDRAQRMAGLVGDRSMAGAIGVPLDEFRAVRAGTAAPSVGFIAGFAAAFGMALGEVAEVAPEPAPATTKEPAA